MPKDTTSAFDFLFREGQTLWGTQQGYRDEMQYKSLEQEKEQTALLKDMMERQKEAAALALQAAPDPTTPVNFSPYIEVQAPSVDIYGLVEELRPEFMELADAQRELGKKVGKLGYLGQCVLQESSEQTDFLESLDNQAHVAYQQREAALEKMGVAILEHRETNRHLDEAHLQREFILWKMDQAHEQGETALEKMDEAHLQRETALNKMDETIAEHRQSNRLIKGLNRSLDLSTAILDRDLKKMKKSLAVALGDIGIGIEGLTDEVIKTRLAVVQTLQDSQSIFLWSHREQMWQRQQTLDVLRSPRRTAAREAWQIGEICRQAGDTAEALRMYLESLRINPSEARNYVSVGLLSLDLGAVDKARTQFAQGARYAGEPSIKATALMYLAKADLFEQDFSKAKSSLELALQSDVTNLEVWFDLAICEIKSNNREKALYYIRNLLLVPTRVKGKRARAAAEYALKIVAETAFQPILPEIREIMKEIINNYR